MNQQARLEQALENLIDECCTETTVYMSETPTYVMVPPSLEAIGEARYVLESIRRERKREEADLADRFYRKHYGEREDPETTEWGTPPDPPFTLFMDKVLLWLEQLGKKKGD